MRLRRNTDDLAEIDEGYKAAIQEVSVDVALHHEPVGAGCADRPGAGIARVLISTRRRSRRGSAGT